MDGGPSIKMAKLKSGTRIYGDVKIDGGIYDSFNRVGIAGSILASTGVGISWSTPTSVGNGTLTLNVSGTGLSGSQTFTANQSGDATFTVTSNATSANTGSTIVARDSSGNFSAGTITAALFGNSTTATTLQTTRTIWGQNFNGSANVTGALSSVSTITFTAEASDAASIGPTISSNQTAFDFNLADDNNNDLWRWRFTPSGSTVYNAMTLTPTANGVSNLAVAGTISGTQLISTVATGTAPLTVSSTTLVTNLNADLLDGLNSATANTVSTIVARDASGNFSAGTITAALSGNSTTATTLQTTRTIWGQNFNGSANVTGALSGATTIDASSDISLGGELNFTTSGNKYIDFYTDNDAGALSTAHLRLVNTASTNFHNAILMTRGGAVTLYHNNSAKLATSSTGVSITGTLTVSSNTLVTNLNADLLDGLNSATANTASTIVARDASGNFSAGTITAALSGNASTATVVNGTTGQLVSLDDRTIAPSEISASRLQFGFTSWANNNTSPYADYLHLRSYTDATGGNDNLVMFRKDAIGMRIYQQSFGSSTAYSSFADVWHSSNDGAGSGLDADLLDGINSASFYRSDATNTASGGVFIFRSADSVDVTNTGQINGLQVFQNNASTDALMSFHVSGDFACHFGLSGGLNDLVVGGWSFGANEYRVWHAGNDGAGSGLDADLLDGKNTGTSGNVIPLLDGANTWSANQSFSSQIISTRAWDGGTGSAQIFLNGATGNRIDFQVSGTGAPTLGSVGRSVGTKIVLYPDLGASAADYALGIESSTLWFSVPTTSQQFRWYGGNSVIATLSGGGTFTATAFSGSGASLTSLNASNLGSGTVPTARLASGTANSTTYLRGDQTWATLSAGITITDDTSTNATRYVMFDDATSGSVSSVNVSSSKLTFNPSTGTLSATIFTSLSDINQKTNIEKITSAVDLTTQINGVRFDWKDTGEKSAGVIAQEVEEILPEIVHTNEDGIKTVNYNGIIALLVESIKEQQEQINILREEITNLKK